MDKKLFRQQILKRRRDIYSAPIDAIIVKHFLASDFYQQAQHLMVYVSFDREINSHGLIQKALSDGKDVIVPICNRKDHSLILSTIKNFPDDLEASHFGLLEVRQDRLNIVDPKILDLIIVPGCAFTEKGHRLGFGGGYYDRFLQTIPKDCPTLALAREDFIFAKIPIQAHDQPVDYIITESRTILPLRRLK